MEKLRCGDCGTVFESNLQECPSCGCPASACSNESEQPQTTHHTNTNTNTGSSVSPETPPKEIPQLPSPMKGKRKMHPFEITCYCLAVICALLFLFTSTTSGGYVNFDGSNVALRHEIAAFGWLIAGRLTGILNK